MNARGALAKLLAKFEDEYVLLGPPTISADGDIADLYLELTLLSSLLVGLLKTAESHPSPNVDPGTLRAVAAKILRLRRVIKDVHYPDQNVVQAYGEWLRRLEEMYSQISV
jgi:hypothetical protein